MVDMAIVIIGTLVSILLAATSYAALEYYRRLRNAQKEYEKARDIIEDIVLSFNRELRREAERIEAVAANVENANVKADTSLRYAENFDRRLEPLENQILHISNQIDTVNASVSEITESNNKTIEKLSTIDVNVINNITNLDTKVRDIETLQEVLKNKISGIETRLEEQAQKLTAVPEVKTDPSLAAMSIPVMPIKRDKAMASLTETEVAVLEFLSIEGSKTAPEIKERVGLSREHTARLMKKLYEEGYLERETGKLPFKYSVKKEMEKLLRKTEPPTAT
jgi:chromosome segregation ATPase